ncbi:hypothetical protein [Hymenobacter weizhouensis]|uniref:hypothetical protein n=1 Tax=Hymenobacter sp. YIM 151500-1 TaxID=2987689 RepID=UPI00222800E4|nr:hypothetical protein [Hymenobacter sp. YIM 151500-1]UYZ62633.1 hypothetical protein OIS53_16725 [Hymenobacter sp. YIM 151500-1]
MKTTRRAGWRHIVCSLLLAVALVAAAPAGPGTPLVLKPAALPLRPTTFFIADVRDARPARGAVAWLLPAAGARVAQPTELQGGTVAALRQFMQRSLPQNPKLRPVLVRVLACEVRETPAAAGQVAGRIQLHLAFDWQQPGRPVPLTEYRGGARYVRPASSLAVVEPTLRQALAGSLTYFNTWMTQAVAHDVRLATAVHPTFRYETRQTEPDTLFHDPARLLVWSDFTGRPRNTGRYAAAVFPSFAYQGRPQVRNGVVELDMLLKIFVVRSSSWVGPGQQTPYNLNHEQRHFDLTRLVAERFRRKATADSLTVEDYNSILQLQYLKSFTEMNRLQEQYDAETRGGLDAAAQERWDRRIDAELRQYGVVMK